MTFDDVTFAVWIGTPFLWLAVELAILWRRGHMPPLAKLPRTISMIARDRGWQFTAAVFWWSASPIHFWLPLGWATRAGTIAFWCIVAALLAWNLVALRLGLTCLRCRPLSFWPCWLRWVNWPVWYLATGPIAAALLFPQDGPLPWSP